MRTTAQLLFTIAIVGLSLGAAPAQAGDKVEICHFPPGNPANFHTITVSSNAVDKHIVEHGDVVGACCGVVCDDGDVCTANFCIDAACTDEPVDCDDPFSCTDDSCVSANNEGCVNSPNDANCAAGETCDPADPIANSGTGCVSDDACITFLDCPRPGADLCTHFACLSGICDTAIVDSVMCPIFESCNPQTGQCLPDDACITLLDCPSPGADLCIHFACSGGICNTDIIEMVQCPIGESCDPQTGQCQPIV